MLGAGLILETLFGKQRPRRWVHLLLGVLYLAGGLLMAFEPMGAAVALTLLIGALLNQSLVRGIRVV